MEINTQVKLKIYEMIARSAVVPTSEDLALELGASVENVESSFQRLYKTRLLVLEPGSTSRIRMAPPFSGIETPFLVNVDGKAYYANCVWDAYGIPAALHQDAVIRAIDGFTGEPIMLEVIDGQPVQQASVAHFSVPAAHWWDDIVYT